MLSDELSGLCGEPGTALVYNFFQVIEAGIEGKMKVALAAKRANMSEKAVSFVDRVAAGVTGKETLPEWLKGKEGKEEDLDMERRKMIERSTAMLVLAGVHQEHRTQMVGMHSCVAQNVGCHFADLERLEKLMKEKTPASRERAGIFVEELASKKMTFAKNVMFAMLQPMKSNAALSEMLADGKDSFKITYNEAGMQIDYDLKAVESDAARQRCREGRELFFSLMKLLDFGSFVVWCFCVVCCGQFLFQKIDNSSEV